MAVLADFPSRLPSRLPSQVGAGREQRHAADFRWFAARRAGAWVGRWTGRRDGDGYRHRRDRPEAVAVVRVRETVAGMRWVE